MTFEDFVNRMEDYLGVRARRETWDYIEKNWDDFEVKYEGALLGFKDDEPWNLAELIVKYTEDLIEMMDQTVDFELYNCVISDENSLEEDGLIYLADQIGDVNLIFVLGRWIFLFEDSSVSVILVHIDEVR